MASKKPFVLRIGTDKMEALEKWASDEFRSTNGQLEWIIDRALREAGRLSKSKREEKPNNNSENGNEI